MLTKFRFVDSMLSGMHNSPKNKSKESIFVNGFRAHICHTLKSGPRSFKKFPFNMSLIKIIEYIMNG